MNTTVLIIIAGIITLLSIMLKFIRLAKENVSIFLNIKYKSDKILQLISQQEKVEGEKSTPLEHFRLAISDWFSVLSIVIVSFLLLHEYLSLEPFALADVFKVGLLFTLLLFSIIILALSIIERRLGYWIDEFMTIVDHIFELIRLNENQGRPKNHKVSPLAPMAKRRSVILDLVRK